MTHGSKPKLRFSKNDSHRSSWNVIVDGEFVGMIVHSFDCAKKFRNFFQEHIPPEQIPHSVRRGWVFTSTVDRLLGIRPHVHLVFMPLLEAKALIRHCLREGICLKDRSHRQIGELARHCRQVELGRIRHR